MNKYIILILIIFTFITLQNNFCVAKYLNGSLPAVTPIIHNAEGVEVGRCRRINGVFYLYDMHDKKVANPASYMNQPQNECYLFDGEGYAIGKCTDKRVILWR